MSWISEAWRWIRSIARSGELERGLDEEIRFHIDQQTERNLRAGMSPDEARRRAVLKFGGIEVVKQRTHDEIRPPLLEESIHDVRYGFRILRRAPTFSVAALVTLAIGIGANATLFSIINAVLLRPLPYPDSERLVWVGDTHADVPSSSANPGAVSYRNFDDWRAQQTVFEHIGAYQPAGGSPGAFVIRDEPIRLEIQRMSADAFAALGVTPILGRTFGSDEDRPGGTPAVVLSHRTWQERFGGTAVVGQPVAMNGVIHQILGVMPAGFSFPYQDIDAWLPLGSIPAPPRVRHDLGAVARLKPGVALEQARAEIATISARLEAEFPDANQGWKGRVEPLMTVVVGDVGRRLWILFGAVGIVLLIACANVANLLLARSSARREEMLVRTALGASRGRIVRQLVAESLLLSFLGAGLALVCAKVGLIAFVTLAGHVIPRAGEVHLDGTVVAFACVLALITGVAFGVAPTWASSGRMRRGLIVAEVALTLLLLTAAGLLLRSFHRLQAVDQGFSGEHVVSFDLAIPGVKYNTPLLQRTFFETLLDKLRLLPGVDEVGMTSRLPLTQKNGLVLSYSVDGQPRPPGSPPFSMETLMASPGYFAVMGIHLLRGRVFDEYDGPDVDGVVIVDEELANRHWPNADPIGRRIRLENVPITKPDMIVVGVVSRVKLGTLSDQGGLGQGYFPVKQLPSINASVVIKSRVTEAALATSIREQVRSVDPAQPIHNLRTIEQVRDRSLTSERLNLILLSVFASVALTVSLSGLYGVLAFSVARRRREIGVRTALGAQPADVMRLILGEGMRLTGAGILIGLIASFWLTRWLSSLLFETRPLDPATFSAVAVLLFTAALVACWIPARGAATADSIRALRDQ